jgi:transposase
MQAIELDGLKKSEASQLFNIRRNTINLWCQRQEETDIKPKPDHVTRQTLKIKDLEKFGEFTNSMAIKPSESNSPTGETAR